MSEEKIGKIVSSAPAQPNPSSIMSAPRDKKKTQRSLIIIGALILSLAINIVLLVVFVSKNEKIKVLETEVTENESLIKELKEKVNSLSSF